MNAVFDFGKVESIVTGYTIYVDDSHSVDYVPQEGSSRLSERYGQVGFASLLVASTVQLRLSIARMQVVYAYGYHPKAHWRLADLRAPAGDRNALLLHDPGFVLYSGEGYRLENTVSWMTWYSTDGSWICLGNPNSQLSDQVAEFASGQRAVLSNGSLTALWLNLKSRS